jgi:hypothetical protein
MRQGGSGTGLPTGWSDSESLWNIGPLWADFGGSTLLKRAARPNLRQHSRTNKDLPGLRFVAEPGSNIGHRPDCGITSSASAQFKCHQHGLECRVLHWHRIVEDHHHTVTGIAFEGAAVSDDEFADGRVVVALSPPAPCFTKGLKTGHCNQTPAGFAKP